MAKGLIGRKVGMTQLFDAEGTRTAVTVIDVRGNVVVQKKSTQSKDGYSALKLGFGEIHKKEKEGEEPIWRLNKPRQGVFLKAGIAAPRRHLKEIRVLEADLARYEVGQELGASEFRDGEFVDAAGNSKGRGFTGVLKRHNFSGMRSSHGVHEFFRHGGSIGMGTWPGKVFKGMGMAGQHGNVRITTQNLRIHKVLADEGLVLVKGSVPGPNGGIVTIRSAVKKTLYT
jgi:large subunit ribosomal protein L3